MRSQSCFVLTILTLAFIFVDSVRIANADASATEIILQEKEAGRLSSPEDVKRVLQIIPPLTKKEKERGKAEVEKYNQSRLSCSNPDCLAQCVQTVSTTASCCGGSWCVGGMCIFGWCVGSASGDTVAAFLLCMAGCSA